MKAELNERDGISEAGHPAAPAPELARRDPLLAAANSVDTNPLLSGTIAHNSEHVLLKLLIAHDTSEASRLLLRGLAQTEKDHKCIRRALFLVVLLFMLSLSGLGYCAILLPEVLSESRYHLSQTLCGLGLGSLVSLVALLGYLLWNRAAKSRLLGECRLRVLAQFHLKGPP